MREPVEVIFPRGSHLAYQLIRYTVGALVRYLYRLRVEGVRNVPAFGGAVLASNHVSYIDPFFLGVAVYPRRVTFLGKAELWKHWWSGKFFSFMGQIPVERDTHGSTDGVVRAGTGVIVWGGLLGIYPEGTRSPDGRLYKGKTGAARVAQQCGTVVIPAAMVGAEHIWPKGARLPRVFRRVTVRFGEPLIAGPEESPREFTERIMEAIAELSGQSRVDSYIRRSLKTAS